MPSQPLGVLGQVLEEKREGLGHAVVAEVAKLEGEPGVDMGEMLGVSGLVEERLEIVLAADGRYDQVHLVRDADRGAERAR